MLERFKRPPELPSSLEALTDVDLPDGWHRLPPREGMSLTAELRRELSRQHILSRHSLAIVARRYDRDDALFYVESPEFMLAQVHLTWSRESSPEWPYTETFSSFEEWFSSQPDDEAYE